MLREIQGIIAVCKDSAEGYRLASEKVKESDVRDIFLNISRRRAGFANQLEAVAGDNGAERPTFDTVSREWEGLKSTVPIEHDLAVLDEVEHGEDATLKAYEGALATELPADVRPIIDEQYWEVRKDHDRVRALRDSHWRLEVPMAGLV